MGFTDFFNLLIRVVLPPCSLSRGQVQIWNLFFYLFAEAYRELVATGNSSYGFTFEVEKREWVNSWFIISDTDFSIFVGSPGPGQALIVNGRADRFPEAHIYHRV